MGCLAGEYHLPTHDVEGVKSQVLPYHVPSILVTIFKTWKLDPRGTGTGLDAKVRGYHGAGIVCTSGEQAP